ncbi:hypothetical protein, partial [Streptomyces sp. NPDC051129]|uniref:hypothetical protein n=1 Tax=Streptomyces sp. NPDC051129 TaxID=3154639 RepID=UPI00342B1825
APVFTPVPPTSCEPDPDMHTLAGRLRHLLDLTAGRPLSLPLGGRFFDAVITADGPEANAIVRLMDDAQWSPGDSPAACGPVIHDPARRWLVWLVPPGTSEHWTPHRYGTCLGSPHELALPPLEQTEGPGPYWLRPCRSDRLVPAGPLWSYLDQFHPGPIPSETILGSMLSTIS